METPARVWGHIPTGPHALRVWVPTVSEGSVEEEKGLQAVFGTVLHWVDDKTPVPHTPVMGLALGVGSMVFVLLLV